VRTSAVVAYPSWIAQFEGDCRDPYLDVRGLVTVGVGFLCPLSVALLCSWTTPAGALATPAEIHAGYDVLTSLPPGRGGGWYRGRAGLTLTPFSFAALYAQRISGFETALRSPAHVGPAWDGLAAVGQIARMRTAWAEGGAAPWPKLDAAIRAGAWEVAARECWPADAGPDPEDPATAHRTTSQPAEYVASYHAVRALYRLAAGYPGEELPLELPGTDAPA
jgi:hypothetical protein